jgi:hypothetical protein
MIPAGMWTFSNFRPEACNIDHFVIENISLKNHCIDAIVMTIPWLTYGPLSIMASDGRCMIGDMPGNIVFWGSIGKTPLAEAPELICTSLNWIMKNEP